MRCFSPINDMRAKHTPSSATALQHGEICARELSEPLLQMRLSLDLNRHASLHRGDALRPRLIFVTLQGLEAGKFHLPLLNGLLLSLALQGRTRIW